MTDDRDLERLLRDSLDDRAARLPAPRGRLMSVLDRVERRRHRRRRGVAVGSVAVVGLGVVGLMTTGGTEPDLAAGDGDGTLVPVEPTASTPPATVDLGEELWWACTDELDRDDGVTYYANCERLPAGARFLTTDELRDLAASPTTTSIVPIPAISPQPATTTTISLPSGPIPLLAIGDGEMHDAASRLTERGYTVLAEEGRQMIDMVPVMAEFKERGVFDNVVVIHLGTSGPFDRETLDAFLAPLNEVPNVIILNNRVERSWTASNNQILADRDQPGDNIILIDWRSTAAECTGNCFGGDGIELAPDGIELYADTIGDITGR